MINNSKKIAIIESVLIAVLFVVCVYLCSSLFVNAALGFSSEFPIGDDGGFHIGRIQTLADDIVAGQFPDKMYMSMSAGYGYPAGIMYPDLFLYPFAFLRILGLPLIWCVVLLILTISTATILISYFSAKYFFKSKQIAATFAILYTLSPYRLYCIFTRMAIGELLALSFLPLIVISIYNIFTYDKFGLTRLKTSYWVALALGVGGTLNSHVLTFGIVVAFLFIPVVVMLIVKQDKNCLFAIIKAAVMCILLSLFFLVPFIDYFITFKSDMASGEISIWYILSYPDRENYFSFNDQFRSGWAIYTAFIIWPVVCLCKTKKAIFKNLKIFGWMMFGFAALFLFLVKCEPFWGLGDYDFVIISEIVRRLASVQFPWRFYGPMVVCLVMLICLSLFVLKRYANGCENIDYGDSVFENNLSKNKTSKIALEVIIGCIVLFSIVVAALYTNNITRPNYVNSKEYFENYVPEADDLYLPEYDRDLKDSAFLNDWLPLEDKIDKNNTEVEITEARQESMKMYMHVENKSDEMQQIDIPMVCYPYMRVVDIDTNYEFFSEKDWWSSFINITLPAKYSGNIMCCFYKPIYWTIAEWISLLSAIGYIVFGIVMYRRKSAVIKS